MSTSNATLYAWVRDAAGNVSGKFNQQQVTIDITPPSVSISPVTSPTNLTTKTISGTVSDNKAVASVNVKLGSGNSAAATISNGTWSFALSGLAVGSNSITVTALDVAGNSSAVSTTIVVEQTFPDVKIIPDGRSTTLLLNAYNSLSSGGTILIGSGTLTETFTANKSITATIKGGYDTRFTSNPGYSVLNGKVTIKAGKVVFEKIQVR
jgi:hypothetical protein